MTTPGRLFLFFVFIFALTFTSAVFAEEIISDDNSISVLYSLSPYEINQSSCWFCLDGEIKTFSCAPECCASDTDENTELFSSFIACMDYADEALPRFLAWEHSPYFTNIPNEAPVTFSVCYRDNYNNLPSTDYPKVTWWPKDTEQYTTCSLELEQSNPPEWIYKKQVQLSTGTYYYRYSVRNAELADEYTLEISSFAVSRRPVSVQTTGSSEQKTVSNARVTLEWSAMDPEGTTLTYRLYVGNDTGSLQLVYEGPGTSYELTGLAYGQAYFWQVEAVNIYGASSRSAVYAFSTISAVERAFNYPNPFNPLRRDTNIVFNMQEAGSAEMSIYTELGDLCRQETFTGLARGANEIVFDGKDGSGNVLYNGTYVCFLRKKYSSLEETDKCRLLVIK